MAKLKSFQALSFPKGSICLQETEYSNNQKYIVLADEESKSSFDQIAIAYAINPERGYFKNTEFNTATTYLYSYNAEKDNAKNAIAEYKGKYYQASVEQVGVEINLAQNIQNAKDQYNNLNYSAEEKAAFIEYANCLNKTCDLYNRVAIDFLKNNIKF